MRIKTNLVVHVDADNNEKRAPKPKFIEENSGLF